MWRCRARVGLMKIAKDHWCCLHDSLILLFPFFHSVRMMLSNTNSFTHTSPLPGPFWYWSTTCHFACLLIQLISFQTMFRNLYGLTLWLDGKNIHYSLLFEHFQFFNNKKKLLLISFKFVAFIFLFSFNFWCVCVCVFVLFFFSVIQIDILFNFVQKWIAIYQQYGQKSLSHRHNRYRNILKIAVAAAATATLLSSLSVSLTLSFFL